MIRFRMHKINIDQFAILVKNTDVANVKILNSIGIKHTADCKSFMILSEFSFEENEKQLMVLNVSCEFTIHQQDFATLVKDNIITIPKHIIDYFIAQTIGTARGILHCKTEGTIYNGIIIPPINATEFLKEDMVIKLS